MSIIIALNGKTKEEVTKADSISFDWKELIPELSQRVKLRKDEEIIGLEISEGLCEVKITRKRIYVRKLDKG